MDLRSFSRVRHLYRAKTLPLALAVLIGAILGMMSLAFAAPSALSHSQDSPAPQAVSSYPSNLDWANIEEWYGSFTFDQTMQGDYPYYNTDFAQGEIWARPSEWSTYETPEWEGVAFGEAQETKKAYDLSASGSYSGPWPPESQFLTIYKSTNTWNQLMPASEWFDLTWSDGDVTPTFVWPHHPGPTSSLEDIDVLSVDRPLPASVEPLKITNFDQANHSEYDMGYVHTTFSSSLWPTKWVLVNVNHKYVSPNQEVTFKLVRNDGTLVNAEWSGGGTPQTDTGTTFTTRFDVHPGFQGLDKTVTAKAVRSGAIAKGKVKVMKPSGDAWVGQYPQSRDIAALAVPFQGNVGAFDGALDDAGANRGIATTYRPSERAHLMYWSSRIARGDVKAKDVPTPFCDNTNPAHGPVYIAWAHYREDGSYNPVASVNAAKQMVAPSKQGGYGIGTNPVAHPSRHERGLAIDWNISWSGTLRIRNADGDLIRIDSTPRTGMNRELWQVGKSYGVIKFELAHPQKHDPPHWSDNGN